jgi:hypothetical protein
MLTLVVRQCDHEVMSESKAERFGIANLDVGSAAGVELFDEGFDVVGPADVLPGRR